MKWKTFFKIFARDLIPFRKKKIKLLGWDKDTLLKLGAIPTLYIAFSSIYAILMISLKTPALKYVTK